MRKAHIESIRSTYENIERKGNKMRAAVHRHPNNVHKREESILAYLYDEGPQTTAELAKAINLSVDRTGVILNLLRDQGSIKSVMIGNPKAPYWILAEDA